MSAATDFPCGFAGRITNRTSGQEVNFVISGHDQFSVTDAQKRLSVIFEQSGLEKVLEESKVIPGVVVEIKVPAAHPA